MPIKCIKRVHDGYFEDRVRLFNGKIVKIPCLFGKHQYIYESKKGTISLVEIVPLNRLNGIFGNSWEIMSLSGNLFKDAERYNTKEHAEKRIKELL